MKWFLLITIVIFSSLGLVQPTFAQDGTPSSGDDESDITVSIDVDKSEEVAEDIVDLTVGTTEATTSAVEDFLERLINTPQSDLMRVLLVVGGVILLVAGWRVSDFIVVIAGFVIGAAMALSLLTTDSTLITVGAVLVGGLVGAAVSVYIYLLGVFLIGAYMGIVLTGALAGELSLTPISPLVLLIGGVIGGLILIGLSFQFLVVISSVVGAQMLTLGLGLDAIWMVLLTVIGIVLQLWFMRHYNYSYRRRPVNPLRRLRHVFA